MKSVRHLMLLGAVALTSACVSQPQTSQVPAPRPAPLPTPAPPTPPPAARDWRDLPLTPGAWFYNNSATGSQALFGPANSEAAFIVRCDRARRQVVLLRAGITTGNTMTVRTSFTARNLPLSVQAEPLPYVFSALAANDRLLDSVAFSRGRFTVEVPGTPTLVIPAWPEPARVVEDCRG